MHRAVRRCAARRARAAPPCRPGSGRGRAATEWPPPAAAADRRRKQAGPTPRAASSVRTLQWYIARTCDGVHVTTQFDQLVFRRGDPCIGAGLPRVEFGEAPLGLVKARALIGKRADLQPYIAKAVRKRLAKF